MADESNRVHKAIMAWHGSHADFDKFQDDKIGTGEGAQVYGHGHYVGEARGTGEEYARNLTSKHYDMDKNRGAGYTYHLDGHPIDADTFAYGNKAFPVSVPGDVMDALRHVARTTHTDEDSLDQVVERLKLGHLHGGSTRGQVKAAKWIEANRSRFTTTYAPGQGRLYELKINADPDKMLDWDALVGENHPDVSTTIKKMVGNNDVSATSGSGLYKTLSQVHGSPAAASKALYAAGVHGIKYKDQFSRNIIPSEQAVKHRSDGKFVVYRPDNKSFTPDFESGSRLEAENWARAHLPRPTYNYVIFDPNMIEHVRKYDLKGKLIADHGVHAQPVDHDPFKDESK